MKSIFINTVWFCLLQLINCNDEAPDKPPICSIHIPSLPTNHPILLKPGSIIIMYPNSDNMYLNLNKGEHVEFSCPGLKLFIDGKQQDNSVEGVCVSGETFDFYGTEHNVTSIYCSQSIKSSVIRTSVKCLPTGMYIRVGIRINEYRFINLYTICYEFKRLTSFSSYHKVNKFAAASNTSVTTEISSNPILASINMDKMYTIDNQRMIINLRSGIHSQNTTYINEDTFLTKLLLVPYEDFIYKFERDACFKYINIIPQWNHIHKLNWYFVEKSIRQYAYKYQVDLEVYTGTYGVAQLYNDQMGVNKQMFLLMEDARFGIPIPFIIWKAVYDTVNKKAIAFLVVNNPHYYRHLDYATICPDISHQLGNKWNVVKTTEANKRYGYMYVCRIDDLRQHITLLPRVEDFKGILDI